MRRYWTNLRPTVPPPIIDGGPLRQLRGEELAANVRIKKKYGAYEVPATTNTYKREYLVDLRGQYPTCTCEDYEVHLVRCKHIIAAEKTAQAEKAAEKGEAAPVYVRREQPRRIQDTYKQPWAKYNAAQKNELPLFRKFLHSLCEAGIPEAPPIGVKGGRPRANLRDVVFAMAYKVYRGVGARRMDGDLVDAQDDEFMSAPLGKSAILKYFGRPEMYPLLYSLLRLSASPFQQIEVDFGVDSTGFARLRYSRWLDVRKGKFDSEQNWLKAHLSAGLTTHVVTAVNITPAYGADSPQMPPLLEETRRGFQIRRVCADKAYGSRANHEFIESLGASPFIAFKSNAIGGTNDAYGRAFHYFSLYRETFLRNYHQRSNIESVMAMVKRKFGTTLFSTSEAAGKNEILCKILCHNICRLVHAVFELGIDPSFRVPPDQSKVG